MSRSPIEADTIGHLIRCAADTFGDGEAMVGAGRRLTFRQLDAESRALAGRLVARGIGRHVHVGISFGNTPDFMVSMLAVARIGAVAVPVSTFAPGRELLRLARHGDLQGVLTARTVVGKDQRERLAAAIPDLWGARTPRLRLPSVPNLRWIELVDASRADAPAWASTPDDDLDEIDPALVAALEDDVVGTDLALMIHTSGTTADPKGVPHTHDTVCFRARYLTRQMQFREGERTHTSQPLFWIGGLTMSFFPSLVAGGTSVWSERFDAGEVLGLIAEERIERLSIYPHQVRQILSHPDFEGTDRSSLELADHRLSPGHRATGIFTPEGHRLALGMSETFGPYSWGSGGTNVIAPIQDVQPGLELRVVDEESRPVADGETGEIVLRGRCVTPGYHRQPRNAAFDPNGWFHTGDRGLVEGATVHFLGRMTEMIKTSGANVAPAEVVAALESIDGVCEAHVLPVPDDVRGELVAAAVVVDADADLDATALRAALRRDLSPFKVPSLIAVFDAEEIPWTPTFKVRRHLLTDMIIERALPEERNP